MMGTPGDGPAWEDSYLDDSSLSFSGGMLEMPDGYIVGSMYIMIDNVGYCGADEEPTDTLPEGFEELGASDETAGTDTGTIGGISTSITLYAKPDDMDVIYILQDGLYYKYERLGEVQVGEETGEPTIHLIVEDTVYTNADEEPTDTLPEGFTALESDTDVSVAVGGASMSVSVSFTVYTNPDDADVIYILQDGLYYKYEKGSDVHVNVYEGTE